MDIRRLGGLLMAALMASACSTTGPAPLQATDQPIDLPRFMGDWYVIASIPVTVPFFSEAGAHNAIESYRLADDGSIETTYTFRKDSFDGAIKRMRPKGFVYNQVTKAEWRMQFLWPFRAAYLIVYVDPDYQTTIIGEPRRRYVWVMARTPQIPEASYAALLQRLVESGYDTAQLQQVPQRWPEDPQAPPR